MGKKRKTIQASILLFSIVLFFACDVVFATAPPSSWKAGPDLKKAWKDRELVYASQAIDGFCSRRIRGR